MTDVPQSTPPTGAQPDTPPPPEPPPDNIGGQAALDGEARDTDDDGNDTRPTLSHPLLLGRSFHLRSAVPSALMGHLQATTKRVLPLVGRRNEDLTDDQRSAALDAQVAFYNVLVKLVVPEERDDFIDHASDVDPPIDGEGWSTLVAAAIETIGGRPTTAS